MSYQKISVGDKNIIVIDDAFDFKFIIDTEDFANNSYFKLAGKDYGDGRMSLYTGNYNLCSAYSQEDVAHIGILSKNKEIAKLVNGRVPGATKLHLLRPFDVCAPHTDGDYETLLYYVNAKWDITYGGQTLFFTENMADIAYTSLFKPNRVVWFDGSIPHMGTPPTSAAKHPRLVLALHFLKG